MYCTLYFFHLVLRGIRLIPWRTRWTAYRGTRVRSTISDHRRLVSDLLFFRWVIMCAACHWWHSFQRFYRTHMLRVYIMLWPVFVNEIPVDDCTFLQRNFLVSHSGQSQMALDDNNYNNNERINLFKLIFFGRGILMWYLKNKQWGPVGWRKKLWICYS